MVDYEFLFFGMVTGLSKGLIVFLMLSLVLDYMRTMIFSNR